MGALTPNKDTIQSVAAGIKANISDVTNKQCLDDNDHLAICRSELDSHTNMIVLGKECFVFESTGKTRYVEPFDPALGITQNIHSRHCFSL